MAKIGQPFYTTKDKGTGLRLMVCYKIVDNHQGRVDVQSKIGRGTTFAIILPYAEPEPQMPAAAGLPDPTGSVSG